MNPHFLIRVTFLGTNSGRPGAYRNNSGILVESAPDNYIMLDCGEGTLLQLCRMFGYAKAMHVLRSLKAVYISHLHSDHQLGFIGVVKQREIAFDPTEVVPPLYVLAPLPHADFVVMYHAKYESILQQFH